VFPVTPPQIEGGSMKRQLVLAFGAFVLAGSVLAQAPPMTAPDASPAASVSQTIGITNVTISYHRPAVNKREVWGKLVPYNEVWRAGANMKHHHQLLVPDH